MIFLYSMTILHSTFSFLRKGGLLQTWTILLFHCSFFAYGTQNEMKRKTFWSGGLEKEQGEIFTTKLLIKEAFKSIQLFLILC